MNGSRWEPSPFLGNIFRVILFPLMALSIVIIGYSLLVLLYDRPRNTKYEKIMAILWLILFGLTQLVWYYLNETALI